MQAFVAYGSLCSSSAPQQRLMLQLLFSGTLRTGPQKSLKVPREGLSQCLELKLSHGTWASPRSRKTLVKEQEGSPYKHHPQHCPARVWGSLKYFDRSPQMENSWEPLLYRKQVRTNFPSLINTRTRSNVMKLFWNRLEETKRKW